jgi:hypothetical protein
VDFPMTMTDSKFIYCVWQQYRVQVCIYRKPNLFLLTENYHLMLQA